MWRRLPRPSDLTWRKPGLVVEQAPSIDRDKGKGDFQISTGVGLDGAMSCMGRGGSHWHLRAYKCHGNNPSERLVQKKLPRPNEEEANLKQLAELCSADGSKQNKFQWFLCYVIQHIAEKSEKFPFAKPDPVFINSFQFQYHLF